MAVCSSDTNSYSTIGDHLRCRKPRNLTIKTPTTTDSNPQQIPSIMQSTRCKSAISSLLLSTFSNNHENQKPHKNNPENPHKNNKNSSSGSKKYTKGSSLLGFGCSAQPEVSVPGVIRSSADWEEKNKKEKKKKSKNKKKQQQLQGVMLMEDSIVQDLWCGADSDSASVDCVRPIPNRNKIDLDKPYHHNTQHGSFSSRQRVNLDHLGGLDLDSSFDASHIGPDVFEARYYHHLRNRSPEGLAEILMFQNGLLMSRRSGGLDRYRDWRLDVDNMTYEDLLELGERIGHVNTGLGEDQIGRCLRKTKLSVVDELSSRSYVPEVEPKCSICQEEYEADDEMGKLECGHAYHLHCIKQWLTRKNACPVCKAEASSK